MNAPKDDSKTATSQSASVTVNPPSARPSSSASLTSEHQQVISSSVIEDANRRIQLTKHEIELLHLRDILDEDWEESDNKAYDTDEKTLELDETMKREKKYHDLKVEERKTEVSTRDAWKRESAKLGMILRKKEVECSQERVMAQLSTYQYAESLCIRELDLNDEYEAFFRAKYGDGNGENERMLQKELALCRQQKKEWGIELSLYREKIRPLEEEQLSLLSKQMDVINEEMDGNVEDAAVATTFSDHPDTVITSVTDNLSTHSTFPSSSSSPPSEYQKAIFLDFTEEAKKLSERAQQQSDLMRRRQAIKDEYKHIGKQKAEMELKVKELKKTMKREREVYDFKVYELKKEVSPFGEVWIRKTHMLGLVMRKQELELSKEGVSAQLLHSRNVEALFLRDICLDEECEAFYLDQCNDENEDDESVLQEALKHTRDYKEEIQKLHLDSLEQIRILEEEVITTNQLLDEINKEIEMDCTDEGANSITDSVTYLIPNVYILP